MEAHLVTRIFTWIVVSLPFILCAIVFALIVSEVLQKLLRKNQEKHGLRSELKSRKQALSSSW